MLRATPSFGQDTDRRSSVPPLPPPPSAWPSCGASGAAVRSRLAGPLPGEGGALTGHAATQEGHGRGGRDRSGQVRVGYLVRAQELLLHPGGEGGPAKYCTSAGRKAGTSVATAPATRGHLALCRSWAAWKSRAARTQRRPGQQTRWALTYGINLVCDQAPQRGAGHQGLTVGGAHSVPAHGGPNTWTRRPARWVPGPPRQGRQRP